MYEPVPDSDEEIEEDEDVKVTDVEGLLSSVTESEGQPPPSWQTPNLFIDIQLGSVLPSGIKPAMGD